MISKENELMVGELTIEEFAQWRGVKPRTISKAKTKYLEELEFFANYHLEGKRKIIIDEVHFPEYIKAGRRTFNEIKVKIPDKVNKSGYDNCKSISNKLEKDFPDLKDSTRYTNILKGVKELYPNRCGVWVLKISDTKVREMSAEEFEIFRQIIKECLGSTEDKQMLVESLIQDGSLAEADAWSYYRELIGLNKSNFYGILKRAKAALNHLPVRGFSIAGNDAEN